MSEKTIEKITPPEYYLSNYSNSYVQKNNKVIFLASTTSEPAELYSLKNGSVTQLTFHNQDFINKKAIGLSLIHI